jgi:uncharacterized protein
MTLYVDSSALVARYFTEPHTQTASQFISNASNIVTVSITYTEFNAALSQLRHAKRIRKGAYENVLNQMELDWLTFERLDVTDSIVYFAGQLARNHLLKGYDAVQLAAALSTNVDKMLTYDHKLARVAASVGLNVLS